MKSPTLVLAALFALALGACESAGSSPHSPRASARAAPVEFTTLASGAQSGLRQPLTRVVRTEFGWRELWLEHAAGGDSAAPAGVDFAEHMVVVVALGERPSGGYSVAIERVVSDAGFLRVEARERQPAGPATAALTQPFVMIRLARHDGPLDVRLER